MKQATLITGPRGSGKTTKANELARDCSHNVNMVTWSTLHDAKFNESMDCDVLIIEDLFIEDDRQLSVLKNLISNDKVVINQKGKDSCIMSMPKLIFTANVLPIELTGLLRRFNIIDLKVPVSTPHKHAALIKAWADGAEIEYFRGGLAGWVITDHPQWDVRIKYRIKLDPYAELKAAHAEGKVIQIKYSGRWVDVTWGKPTWSHPIDCYRIKPKPHIHQELMDAHAAGAEIQYHNRSMEWVDCPLPIWYEYDKYRIKPKEVVMDMYVNPDGVHPHCRPNLHLFFKGDDLVKAEVIK